MTNLLEVSGEIGLFESAKVFSHFSCENVAHTIAAMYPCPTELSLADITDRLSDVHDTIKGSGKTKVLLLTPEVALVEMFSKDNVGLEFIIALPYDMEEDRKSRVTKNMPRNVNVTFIDEPSFPQGFIPKNGIILATGYRYSDRVILLPQTYRLMAMFGGFLGRKVFAPVCQDDIGYCPAGWMCSFTGGLFNAEI